MTIFNQLEHNRQNRGGSAVALIDPDTKYNDKILPMINLVNESDFDIIFVGGSSISDNDFNKRLRLIKKHTNLPVIIFPGSSSQLSNDADAILFLSLISGRNPQYLISEHVKSAPIIHNLGIEAIPTAYILLDGGIRSSVEIVSDTKPLPMEKIDIILAHALAGQYLGKTLLFLEAGSGAANHAACKIISHIKPNITMPIIVGGGINTPLAAKNLIKAGAGYIVTGTQLEHIPNKEKLIEFTQAIHQNECN